MTYHRATDCDVPKLDVAETWTCACGRTWKRTQSHRNHTYYEIVTETSQSDEHTTEVVEVVENGRSTVWLRSELIKRTIDSDELDANLGIEVHQDGRDLKVVAGTTGEVNDGDVTLQSYINVEPAEARKLADALYVAADNAERAYDGQMPDHDTEEPTLLDKLLGGKQ